MTLFYLFLKYCNYFGISQHLKGVAAMLMNTTFSDEGGY